MVSSIAIDFDGVIHKYSKGWTGEIPEEEPSRGAFDGIITLMRKGYAVFIHSTRNPEVIGEWLDRNSFPGTWGIIKPEIIFWNELNILGITNRKLPAVVYLDDRGLRHLDWHRSMVALDFLESKGWK